MYFDQLKKISLSKLLMNSTLNLVIPSIQRNLFVLTLNIPAVDRFDHQFLFLRFSQKFFPATYDKTLCKFLLYTYEDSHNLFWSKIISREHVEYIYVAWVENVNFKICNFRVLRSILEQSYMKQKLFRIKKYKRKVTFVFWFEHFLSQKT